MTWNYRILKKNEKGEETFGIHEVYYAKDGSPQMYSEFPVRLDEQSLEDLQESIKKLGLAFGKPCLEPSDFSKKAENLD